MYREESEEKRGQCAEDCLRGWEQKGERAADRRQSRRERTEDTHHYQKEADLCDWGHLVKKN